jgi:hypothetical protein
MMIYGNFKRPLVVGGRREEKVFISSRLKFNTARRSSRATFQISNYETITFQSKFNFTPPRANARSLRCCDYYMRVKTFAPSDCSGSSSMCNMIFS